MRRFMLVRIGVAIVIAAAVLIAPVTAASADVVARKPRPNSVTAYSIASFQGTHEIGDPFEVTFAGLSRTVPVTVSWGDGTSTTVTGDCSVRTARNSGSRCTKSVTHEFPAVGTYAMSGVQSGKTVWRQGITVEQWWYPTLPDGWQQDMLNRVNALRAEVGVAPLALCGTLGTAAQGYANVLESTQYFSHLGQDGSLPWQRVNNAGYGSYVVGENIASGQRDTAAVMDAWRNSPGHYAAMTSPGFGHVGFGYAYDRSLPRRTSWVQNFGSGGVC